ncbi:MAG: hypothetical protein ACOC44_11780 [Promethearchaeia archaeon]
MNDFYNSLKEHNGKIYTGMKVGSSHRWFYKDGTWIETKKAPNKWEIKFDCMKHRAHKAPRHSGATINTKYHWYILADQMAKKLDANTYMTSMKGVKFKMGHKRPNWRDFSYTYSDQKSYKEQLIVILESMLQKLRAE